MEKKDNSKKLIPILAVITVIALGVTVWALFFRESGPVLAPDYAPQEEEQHAETIPNDDGEKMEQPDGGGSVSLSYSREVMLNTLGVTFMSPSLSMRSEMS